MTRRPREPAERDTRLARLVLTLRSQGVTDPAVLAAIERTPRDLFTPDLFKDRSWEDSALPIACGQTISQPTIVGLMTQALTIEPRDRVLEIGTGSGYQTAVLSPLVTTIYTIERIAPLMERARERIKELGMKNVRFRHGDGSVGWKAHGPFDAILVAAAPLTVPEALLKQLRPGGRLIVPVGPEGEQQLIRYTQREQRLEREMLGAVAFVPLLGGVG